MRHRGLAVTSYTLVASAEFKCESQGQCRAHSRMAIWTLNWLDSAPREGGGGDGAAGEQ
jgi:hypothetical protein